MLLINAHNFSWCTGSFVQSCYTWNIHQVSVSVSVFGKYEKVAAIFLSFPTDLQQIKTSGQAGLLAEPFIGFRLARIHLTIYFSFQLSNNVWLSCHSTLRLMHYHFILTLCVSPANQLAIQLAKEATYVIMWSRNPF